MGTAEADALQVAEGPHYLASDHDFFSVPRVPQRSGSRSGLLGRKKVKKVERSEAPLRTAFFRMVAELNDLSEVTGVTGVAEWRFRELINICSLTKTNGADQRHRAGSSQTELGDQTYGQPK